MLPTTRVDAFEAVQRLGRTENWQAAHLGRMPTARLVPSQFVNTFAVSLDCSFTSVRAPCGLYIIGQNHCVKLAEGASVHFVV
jgi:hypothetical protein